MINLDKSLFLHYGNNVIAITSGVGSQGKTWLSVTLAHALNLIKQSVLLFDADNGLSNIGFQLGKIGDYLLDNAIKGNICLNQAISSLNRKKFDCICGATGDEILENTPDGRLQILREELNILTAKYDKIIIDMPPSEKIINHLLPQNADLILVCTNDPSNLVSTYQFLQQAVGLYKYKSLQIVVNYANSYEEGLQTYNTLRRACEKFIKNTPDLLGVIRRDTRVRDAIRSHMLLLNKYPDSEAAEDVRQIAKRILNLRNNDE